MRVRGMHWLWIVPALLLICAVGLALVGLWMSPPNGGRALARAAGIPFPAVVAHRGASWNAPEETRPAYLLARRMGADYLECDIQRTRDGVLVAFHDDTLERTTDAATVFPGREGGHVGEFTLAELRRLDVGSWFNRTRPDRARPAFAGERIVTLDELIDLAEGGEHRPGLYVETKSPERFPGVEKQLVAALTARGWIAEGGPVVVPGASAGARVRVGLGKGRLLFQSFSEESLRRLAAEAPGVPRVLLVEDETVDRLGWRGVLERAARLGGGIGSSSSNALWWRTGPAHDAGLLMHPWTINEGWRMRLLRWCGVDGFFTDRPALGLEVTGRVEAIDTAAMLKSLGY